MLSKILITNFVHFFLIYDLIFLLFCCYLLPCIDWIYFPDWIPCNWFVYSQFLFSQYNPLLSYLSPRYLRSIQQRSRTMVSGWGIKVELAITTCTRNTETQHSMVRSNRCTMKWHPVTVSDSHAFRSSRLPPSRPSSASVRARNSSMTRRSNSLSSSGKSDPLLGSLKPLSRRLALISSCRLGLLYQSSFHYDSVFFMVLVFGCLS